MARPTSFRLAEELLGRLDQEAAARGVSITALVASMLDEGLKTSRFPGVIYRDGPTGRRAGLVAGPDVWEIVRALKQSSGSSEHRIQSLAEHRGLSAQRVSLALDFYASFPEEIEARIEADEREAARLRQIIDRRERLLAS